jgi:hypothetical protein
MTSYCVRCEHALRDDDEHYHPHDIDGVMLCCRCCCALFCDHGPGWDSTNVCPGPVGDWRPRQVDV